MGGAGYHPSIGLLPQWDVLYVTSTASSLWGAVQRNAYSAGRYGIHFRDETTQRPLRFSSYPNLVVSGGSSIVGAGSSTTNSYTPNSTGGFPPVYGSTHHPSMGFMAYVLTGWMYHLETAQFVATASTSEAAATRAASSAEAGSTTSASRSRGATAAGSRTACG